MTNMNLKLCVSLLVLCFSLAINANADTSPVDSVSASVLVDQCIQESENDSFEIDFVKWPNEYIFRECSGTENHVELNGDCRADFCQLVLPEIVVLNSGFRVNASENECEHVEYRFQVFDSANKELISSHVSFVDPSRSPQRVGLDEYESGLYSVKVAVIDSCLCRSSPFEITVRVN